MNLDDTWGRLTTGLDVKVRRSSELSEHEFVSLMLEVSYAGG